MVNKDAIVQRLLSELLEGEKKKMSGSVTLTLELNAGGISRYRLNTERVFRGTDDGV